MPHPSFQRVDHRPWPLPGRRWSIAQSWMDLAFIHWPVAASALRPLVPASLEVEEFDGTAWIGIVPFHMKIRHRLAPPLGSLSYFPELNVRTYVRRNGLGGVWFFSLDTPNPLAVWGARRFFHLPYFRSHIAIRAEDGAIEYEADRLDGAARFCARYRPTGDVREAQPGTIDHWLTERYCLFAGDPAGRLNEVHVHHMPWPLQPAEAQIDRNTMLRPLGLDAPQAPPLVHFARRLDVSVWSPVPAD